jgi:hypothetical protein
MDEDDNSVSGELDEFEESYDDTKKNLKNSTAYQNKPYDEAYEVSQDLSMAESFDGRGDKVCINAGGRLGFLSCDPFIQIVLCCALTSDL